MNPPLSAVEGAVVRGLRRLGKRIVFEFDGATFLVLHLMIAGPPEVETGAKAQPSRRRVGLAAFDFAGGTLLLTEAATKKRASLHVVRGEGNLGHHDPGGMDVLTANLELFESALRKENHTLKRALTDPHLFSGIGNAYSDEILHAARLSPFKLTQQLTPEDVRVIFAASRDTLREWTARLQSEAGDTFPEKVTAFREGMAVHGRFGRPCPRCGTTVQRIVHGEHEVNYCPECQTGGRLLADRSLSKLLKDDWPRTLEELEERKK